MRLAVLVAVVVLSLAAAAPAATPVRATLKTTTATPVVDAPWRWTVRVRNSAGKPIRAKMRLQILFGKLVVGCWKRTEMVQCTGANSGTWLRFKGKRSGVLTWPAQSLGVKLTFQAVVVAGKRTIRLRAPVMVQPKP